MFISKPMQGIDDGFRNVGPFILSQMPSMLWIQYLPVADRRLDWKDLYSWSFQRSCNQVPRNQHPFHGLASWWFQVPYSQVCHTWKRCGGCGCAWQIPCQSALGTHSHQSMCFQVSGHGMQFLCCACTPICKSPKLTQTRVIIVMDKKSWESLVLVKQYLDIH